MLVHPHLFHLYDWTPVKTLILVVEIRILRIIVTLENRCILALLAIFVYSCSNLSELCTYKTFKNLVGTMFELSASPPYFKNRGKRSERSGENDLNDLSLRARKNDLRSLKTSRQKSKKRSETAPANRRNLARSSSKTIWNQPGICQNLSTTVWKNDMTEKSLQCKIPGSRSQLLWELWNLFQPGWI